MSKKAEHHHSSEDKDLDARLARQMFAFLVSACWRHFAVYYAIVWFSNTMSETPLRA